MSVWNEEVFKPAFARAGMWIPVQALLAGTDVPISFLADFCKPDVNPMTGVQSSDYEIEYEYRDAPGLAEGDQVIVAGELYRLRQAPRIEGLEATGFFRKALLTKVGSSC